MNLQNPSHYRGYHPPPPPLGYGRQKSGGSGGATDDAYYQHPRRSPKFSEYGHGQQVQGHGSGGPPLPPPHYQAPFVAQESRYPPSSAARRHESNTRHPPPLHHHGQEYLPHQQPLHPPPAPPHPADKFGKTITVSNRLTIRDNTDDRSDCDTDPEDKGDEENNKVLRRPSVLLPSKRSSAFLPYRPSAATRPSSAPVVTIQLAPPATTTTSNSSKARSSSVIDSDGASDDEIMAANSQMDDEDPSGLGKADDDGGMKESRDDNNATESKKTTSSEEDRVSSVEEGRDRPIILGPSSSFPPEVAFRGGWNGEGRVRKPNPITTTAAPGEILKRIKRTRSDASEKDGTNAEDDTPKHININRQASFSHPRQMGDVHRYSDSGDPNKRLRSSNFGFDQSKGRGEGYDGYNYKPPCDENRSLSSLENETEDRHDQPATTGGTSHEITRYSQQGRSLLYDQNEHYHQELQRGDGTTRGIQSSWMTPNTTTAPPLDCANSHEYAGTGSLLNYSRSLSWEVPAGTLSGIGNSLTFGRSLSADEHGKEETVMDKGIPSLKSAESTLNVPQRKRPVLLAPRPLPTTDETRDNSCDKGKQKHEVPPGEPLRLEEEGRLQHQQSSSYAPTTVHFPAVRQHPMHHHHQSPEHYHQPYPHQQNHHPSHMRSYDQQYYNPQQHPPPLHSPSQYHYQNDRGNYDYDPRYEPPRGDYRGPSGVYPVGGGEERRHDPYESSGRYNPHSTPPVYSSGRDGAPWGPPPHTSNNPRKQQQPRHFDNNFSPQQYPRQHPPNDAGLPHYNGTPGGHDAGLDGGNGIGVNGYTSDSRSFDSTLSKKSFRSLDDLEDPGQSLLYRPSFSWERGLDVPAVPGGTPPRSSAVALPLLPPLPSSSLSQLSQQQKIMRTLTMRNEVRTIGDPNAHIPLILLLAMPQDRHCLSETLCIVRNNVEVFTATESDINAPAPGRKRPIQVGQVGLRCVYCRMCHQRDRVKRATCFPSSMKRIYRAVIDMKLDHFKNCPYVPTGLKARLDQLQAGSTRSTGMTVQYFVKSAKELGMTDNVEDGVFIDLYRVGNSRIAEPDYNVTSPPVVAGGVNNAMVPYDSHSHTGQDYHQTKQPKQRKSNPHPRMVPHGARSHDDIRMIATSLGSESEIPEKRFAGKVLLSLPEDENFLSPLRCFLREHVCAFTASQHDIAVRTPTTFSVRVGQVGVGCVHCLAVPPKSRSNRAVCFPFAMARIYQSVADIQRFHLGECRMMPPNVRAEFLRLQSESAKGSRGLATRMYWIDSAKKIGLTDGTSGMYFCRDPSLPPPDVDSDTSVKSMDILDQAVSYNDSRSICHSLVVPEDKPTIAEFLYLVMEQLRPCRFTDADRNKRRSKNVGCIGVECKHCAGKIDGRKFFWSSVSAAESNFVSVHSHMLTCKYIPEPLKAELTILKSLRREQTSRLKTGSQKAFFIRVWSRLHGEPIQVPPPSIEDARKLSSAGKGKSSQQRFFAPEDSAGHPFMSGEMDADAEYGDNTGDYEISPILCSNSSYEINTLFQTKSTLSSMPSVDDLIVKNDLQDAETSKVDLSDASASNINKSSSNESAINIETVASKGSLNTVARNMSAVSMNCQEEGEK